MVTKFRKNQFVADRETGEGGVIVREYPLSLTDLDYYFDVEFDERGLVVAVPSETLTTLKQRELFEDA